MILWLDPQDLLGIDWDNILQIEKLDPNFSFDNFYSSITPIINHFIRLSNPLLALLVL